MRDLKHPAKPLFRSESDVDVTIHSDEESDVESLGEDNYKRSCQKLEFFAISEKIESF